MVYKKKVTCETSNLEEIRKFLKRVLHQFQIVEEEAHMVVLAVDEVCANRIIHSNACNPEELIEVSVERNLEEDLIIEISDQGATFDIESYHAPSMKEVVDEKKKGGMGLILVKKIMDKIEVFEVHGKSVCRLSKKVS